MGCDLEAVSRGPDYPFGRHTCRSDIYGRTLRLVRHIDVRPNWKERPPGESPDREGVAMMRSILRGIAACLIVLSASYAQAQCIKYNTPVTLTGTISVQVAAGERSSERYFLLKLDKALCAIAAEQDDPENFGVWAVSLLYSPPAGPLLTNDELIARRPPWLGRHVSVRGKLFYAGTIHHHTPVLIEAADISLLR